MSQPRAAGPDDPASPGGDAPSTAAPPRRAREAAPPAPAQASGNAPAQDRSPEPAALARIVRDATAFDRRAVSPGAGLLAAIPVVALLGGGVALGDTVAAVTMGAGAMLVGIAWRVRGGRPPLALMTVDAALMALSTFVGCVTGAHTWAHLLVLCLWGLLGGLLIALGPGGGVLGTQSLIAVVVFGRFSEPAAQALGLAGYVLAGGLTQVVLLSLVRWPTPLRVQRETTAAAYRELAHVAAGPVGYSTLGAASALDEAQSALASGSLFGDPALVTLRSLVGEGMRMRVQLTAILAIIERVRARGTPGLHELAGAASAVLTGTAAALGAAARVIAGERQAEPELAARVESVTAGAEHAAELAGLTAAGTSELRVASPGAEPPPTDEVALSTQLVRRLAAVAGQLRAVASLAPAAGRGGGLRSRRPQPRTRRPLAQLRGDLELLHANATPHSPAGRHALRLAIVVPLASLLARELPLHRGYWMVVAAATVLRPEFGATFTRGGERALGTSLGVALAGGLSILLHPAGGVTVALVAVLAWAGYAVFPASFAVGFGFITALTVFLLNALSPDTLSTASARLVDTLVGGALGLIVFAVWPTWSRLPARRSLVRLIAAQRAYVALVLQSLIDGRQAPEEDMRQRSRRARLERTAAQEAIARSLHDPPARRIDPDWSQTVLAATRRLVQAVHVLRLDVQDARDRDPLPALAPLAAELDELLGLVGDRVQSDGDAAPAADPPDLPDPRSEFTRFARTTSSTRDVVALVGELDEVVDAAGALATLVGLDPADPPAMRERAAPRVAAPPVADRGVAPPPPGGNDL